MTLLCLPHSQVCDSILSIANCYRLDGLEFKRQWRQGFCLFIRIYTGPWAHSAYCTMATRNLSWEKSRPSIPIQHQDKEWVELIPVFPLCASWWCFGLKLCSTHGDTINSVTSMVLLPSSRSSLFDIAATIHFWVVHSRLLTAAAVLNIVTASGETGACRKILFAKNSISSCS